MASEFEITPHPICKSVTMYKRTETAKVWQYRFYVRQEHSSNGKPINERKSTGKADLQEAFAFAYDAYRRVTGQIESGEPVSLSPEVTVNDCYQFARRIYLEDVQNGDVAKNTWDSLERVYLREIDPELGTKPIKAINLEVWTKFQTALFSKKPHLSLRSKKYVKSALVMCLNAAIDMKVINDLPTLESQIRRKRRKKDDKPTIVWFNLKSQNILLNALDTNIADKIKTGRKNEIAFAESLRDYVHFALYTGMRTEELNTLTFNEIEKVQKKRTAEAKRKGNLSENLVVINLQSKPGRKAGGRRFTGVDGSGQAINRIMKRRGVTNKSTELVFPNDHKKPFRQIIDNYNLRHDRNGNIRNKRTLRHTFICNRICEGMDLNSIALKCGNSARIIERDYSRGLEDIDKQEYIKMKATLDKNLKLASEFDADWD